MCPVVLIAGHSRMELHGVKVAREQGLDPNELSRRQLESMGALSIGNQC